jgi:hypothetical protein
MDKNNESGIAENAKKVSEEIERRVRQAALQEGVSPEKVSVRRLFEPHERAAMKALKELIEEIGKIIEE